MHTLPDRVRPSASLRLQLPVRPLLCQACGHHTAMQSEGNSHAGGHCTVQAEPSKVRDSWFAQRVHLGTPLSWDEIRHGVNHGIVSATLLS
jgi:hypothetical protein